MSDFPKMIPAAEAFQHRRNIHGVILNEFDVSRTSTALQGLQAVLAVLQRREIDVELEFSEGLTFGPGTALGLIAAAATCAELVDQVVTGCYLGVRADCDTPAYEHLMEARHRVREANREGAEQ